MFPVGWLTVGAAAVTGDPVLDRILVEEDAWGREANDRRERDRVAILASEASGRTAGRLSTAMAVFGLLTVVMGYLKAGRGHVVAYTQRVDANIPTEPPALASYVYYTKQVQGGALGATVVRPGSPEPPQYRTGPAEEEVVRVGTQVHDPAPEERVAPPQVRIEDL